MFKKMCDGFMFTIGAVLALSVVKGTNAALVDIAKKVGETEHKCECTSSGECKCDSTEE